MAGYTARLCSALWAPPFGLRPSPAKPAPPSSQHELAAVERLRESGGRCRLDPAQAQHRAEGVLAEPALVALGPEDRHEMGDLLPASLLVERHVRVRPAEVAVELGDLVLEDQVVAKAVVGEVRDQSVILVSILAMVREHE